MLRCYATMKKITGVIIVREREECKSYYLLYFPASTILQRSVLSPRPRLPFLLASMLLADAQLKAIPLNHLDSLTRTEIPELLYYCS